MTLARQRIDQAGDACRRNAPLQAAVIADVNEFFRRAGAPKRDGVTERIVATIMTERIQKRSRGQ